jgi:sterol desaturase/sphingolipid hydroxylase (fatty acid hydroxylase superfamily)
VSNLVLYSIPLFVLLVVLEVFYTLRRTDLKGYTKADTTTSLTLGIMNVGINAGAKFLSIPFFAWGYEHRFVDIPAAIGGWSWVVLFFAEDHSYYWFHRLHHEVRVLWASHVPHHSSEQYNLSTALRQPLLTPFTGPLFWFPLALVGFPPVMILTAQAWSLIYQFWLHTETIGKLGPLEWVLNTPSHHRVHHGSNVIYLDKNHAGVLIIWDRLFGTFQEETDKVDFGLTTNIKTHNLIKVGLHEYGAIARDMGKVKRISDKLGYAFAPPGWSHDGSTKTATELQRELRQRARDSRT